MILHLIKWAVDAGEWVCGPTAFNREMPRVGRVVRSAAYGRDRKQRIDVYVPSGSPPFPILVFIHGGAWIAGDKFAYARICRTFAAEGFPKCAGLAALATPDATGFIEEQLRFRRLAFRIVTPPAGKGASLEKESGTNARTIMDGEPLDVENGAARPCFGSHPSEYTEIAPLRQQHVRGERAVGGRYVVCRPRQALIVPRRQRC